MRQRFGKGKNQEFVIGNVSLIFMLSKCDTKKKKTESGIAKETQLGRQKSIILFWVHVNTKMF